MARTWQQNVNSLSQTIPGIDRDIGRLNTELTAFSDNPAGQAGRWQVVLAHHTGVYKRIDTTLNALLTLEAQIIDAEDADALAVRQAKYEQLSGDLAERVAEYSALDDTFRRCQAAREAGYNQLAAGGVGRGWPVVLDSTKCVVTVR